MNKKTKKVLIVIICVLAALILAHLTMNNLIPFVKNLHSGAAF